jgi:hypothetical protein
MKCTGRVVGSVVDLNPMVFDRICKLCKYVQECILSFRNDVGLVDSLLRLEPSNELLDGELLGENSARA